MKRRSPPKKSDRAGADPRFVEDWLGHAVIVTRPGEESLQSLYGAAALLSR